VQRRSTAGPRFDPQRSVQGVEAIRNVLQTGTTLDGGRIEPDAIVPDREPQLRPVEPQVDVRVIGSGVLEDVLQRL
jgi:hypothetical protein